MGQQEFRVDGNTAVPKRLFQAKIPTVLGSVFTNGSAKAVVTEFVVCNTGNVATTFSLELLPNGETYDLELHRLYNEVSLARNESKIFQIGTALEPLDVVRMVAGNAGVSVHCTGMDFAGVV